ncbi:hypothetical protein [Pelagicoccus sp. SDUM812003]|uniref:hypothetical protein n=1 Tax=Pelagicoccus sp. SDUM812003 TaxID=3041267 RepID=UPI00280E9993|nr:hypothetical protein [Pelagicoccus sp. SDUM812003]MDQ8205762.1 hypothetical protein [Pelagicoccus sp. SDUM812003]
MKRLLLPLALFAASSLRCEIIQSEVTPLSNNQVKEHLGADAANIRFSVEDPKYWGIRVTENGSTRTIFEPNKSKEYKVTLVQKTERNSSGNDSLYVYVGSGTNESGGGIGSNYQQESIHTKRFKYPNTIVNGEPEELIYIEGVNGSVILKVEIIATDRKEDFEPVSPYNSGQSLRD